MTIIMAEPLPLDLFRDVKSLEKYSKTVVKNLVDHLHQFSTRPEEEVLHDIRVDVKKVKTILNLVGFSQKKFKAHKAFLPFRNIFRKAGAIREPEVLHKLLSDFHTEKDKKNGANRGQAVDVFLDDVPFFIDNINREWKKIKPRIASVHRKDFKSFIHNKMDEVEMGLSPKPDMKNIHKTRKAIKAVLYLYKVKGDLAEEAETFYSEMEDTIGLLHDKQVLLANLKKLNGQANKSQLKRLAVGCGKDEIKIEKLTAEYYQ